MDKIKIDGKEYDLRNLKTEDLNKLNSDQLAQITEAQKKLAATEEFTQNETVH